MVIKETSRVTDKDLLKAISIRFCRHFPAMNMVNAIGGYPSTEWKIIRNFNPIEMIEEAEKRGLDLSELETSLASCSCCWSCVVDSPIYKVVKAAQKTPQEVAK